MRFTDYSLGTRRPVVGLLLRRGILTSDGHEWAHLRALPTARHCQIPCQLRDLRYTKYCLQNAKRMPAPRRAEANSAADISPAPALRLLPPLLSTGLAIRDTVPTLGGRDCSLLGLVPKGCLVIYSVHAMHRRKGFLGATPTSSGRNAGITRQTAGEVVTAGAIGRFTCLLARG